MGLFAGGSAKRDDQYSKVLHPFDKLQKETVLQEARIFHDSHIVREEPKRCCRILAQLLRLQDVGAQPFTETEATEVFFGATKLFVSNDEFLRRMVYLFLKEIYLLCDPNNVIIITSSLTKDMTCDINSYRANSLRVLVRIIDSAMLGAIERYIKQAIVASSSEVASSALVSAVHLYESSPDSAAIVRRWISETQQAIQSPNPMVQFHGIQLLYLIKSRDRMGVSKLVSQFSQKQAVKSPLARVLLIRYASKLIRDEMTEGRVTSVAQCRQEFLLLEASLKDSSDMVAYEAAHAICILPMTEAEDLDAAVNRLRTFLKSSIPSTRYASLKTLCVVARRQPRLVSKCNAELETLLKDKNRGAATLAVATLLRTVSESSIDDLLEQISPFIDTIDDDEYRISVVKCLLKLCLRCPSKHLLLVSFLSKFLKDRGTFEFKRSIVVGIVTLIMEHPEAAETSLLYLCEYIEDCEYEWLSIEILHILGEIGPMTSGKQQYIRFVYNRIMLDENQIRAAAVTVLCKFAAKCPSLRPSILPLLNRSLDDSDDEVRDRAVVAVKLIRQAMEENAYVPPPGDAVADEIPPDIPNKEDPAAYVFAPLPLTFKDLEQSLLEYKKVSWGMANTEPLMLSTLPVVETTKSRKADFDAFEDSLLELNIGESEIDMTTRTNRAAIFSVPELATFGRVFRTCPPIPLTESETEYVVHCIKHILGEHVILQFSVQNTIEDQRLDDVIVNVSPSDDVAYEIVGEISADEIGYGDVKDCFTILKRNHSTAPCTFVCNLNFIVVMLDSGEETGDTYQEEYTLEEFTLSTADFNASAVLPDSHASSESKSYSYFSSASTLSLGS